jgi:two-component sensor histidine kinase
MEARVPATAEAAKPIAAQGQGVLPQAASAEAFRERMLDAFRMIETMLRFQPRPLAAGEAAYHAAETARQRVQALTLVHRQLPQQVDSGAGGPEVDLGGYLRGLVEGLAHVFGRGLCVFTVEAQDGTPMPPGPAITVGMLATELVMNACKHAFREGTARHVKVALAATEDGYCLGRRG